MKVITDGTEQLINLLANDTPLQLPTIIILLLYMRFRYDNMLPLSFDIIV